MINPVKQPTVMIMGMQRTPISKIALTSFDIQDLSPRRAANDLTTKNEKSPKLLTANIQDRPKLSTKDVHSGSPESSGAPPSPSRLTLGVSKGSMAQLPE
jgi:hypothetical protein